MAVKFKSDLDSKRFESQLRMFSSGLGGIFNELLARVGQDMVSEIKSGAAGAFTDRTGNLSRAINCIPTDTGIVLTTKKNLKRQNLRYANIVEHGADIRAKKEKYLTFKINGEWKKVSSVRVRPRPFMRPVFEEYWQGENAKGYKALAGALQKKMEESLG
jgi:hypothetical protein